MASLHSSPVIACPLGHELGPRAAAVSWLPCGCSIALERNRGHLTVQCRTCESQGMKTIRYDPPHVAGYHERTAPPPPLKPRAGDPER